MNACALGRYDAVDQFRRIVPATCTPMMKFFIAVPPFGRTE